MTALVHHSDTTTMTQKDFLFHAGEATVLAREGQLTDAMPDMYRTNHEAPRLAITWALRNEPTVDELIANRHTIRHDMDDWS